jgi:hypothetical protein
MNTTQNSYWSSQTKSVRITSWSHFLSLTNGSDKELNCKTYIYKGTLDLINKNLLGYENDTWRYSVFHNMVEDCFQNKSIVYTDDPDQTDDKLLKINSLYYLIMSFRKGEKMKDPLCFNYFETDGSTVGRPPHGKIGIHPGHTRLLLGDIYKQPLYVIIFDYTNGLFPKRYRHLRIWDTSQTEQQLFPITNRQYIFAHTRQQRNSPGTIHGACGDPINGIAFREVKGDDAFLKSLAHPTTYMPPRKFEKTENSVIVNGIEVLRKINKKIINYKYNYYWELQA